MALERGKINNIPIQTLTTTLNYRTEQAQVAGYLEIGPLHSRLVWKGSVPVKISLLPFAFALAPDGLDLRVHSERVNLSLLTSVSKEVQAAEGPVDLMVEARGDPRHPRVSGYVRWSAGSLKVHQAGTPYACPRRDSPPGDKIVIPGIVIKATAPCGCPVKSSWRAPLGQARLQTDNFLLLDRGQRGVTNGFIDLKGPLGPGGHRPSEGAQGPISPHLLPFRMDPDVILCPKPKLQAEAGGPGHLPEPAGDITLKIRAMPGSSTPWAK
jgi:hypothetical protein